MRVLVTGAAGLLGTEVVAVCSAAGDDVVAADRARLDVTDRDQVLGAVLALRPDLVVHCAARTDVDGCESDVDGAMAANALGARHVADACARAGSFLVQLSTDLVFDGTKEGPYDEWDRPAPLSVYGRSKLGGEDEVRALHGAGSAVVRTSWVNGAAGPCVVRTVLDLLAADPARELAFVDDQRGCPTDAFDLAVAVRRLGAARTPGLFHITNQGPTTWYHFVADILVAAGASADQVRPVSTADLRPRRPAPRPANSVLDNAVLRLSGLPLLDDHHEPLLRLVKEMKR